MRPPRGGFSVSRHLAERARAARAATDPARGGSGGDAAVGPSGAPGGLTGMVEAMRDLVERLATTARQAQNAFSDQTDAGQPDLGHPDQHQTGHAETSGRTVTLGGGAARVVFGYTLRMGRDGISAEPFGDVPERPAGGAAAAGPRPTNAPGNAAAMPAARQPIAEVFEDGAAVVVIAELPGAEAGGIVCRANGTNLLIEAAGPRRYRKELALPVPVRPEIVAQSFQNGILELRLARAGTS